MADIVGFVQEVLGVGVVVSALLGIAAFLGRSQIAHWLNKDIERIKSQYQAELESQKAVHMRDLETYKVSLIAEAERARAEQLVATSAAVKFSEHRYTAINALSQAQSRMAVEALGLYTRILASIGRGDAFEEWVENQKRAYRERTKALSDAIASAAIFMDPIEIATLENFNFLVSGVVSLGEVQFLEMIGTLVDDFDMSGLEKFSSIHDHQGKLAYMQAAQREADELVRTCAIKILRMQ